MNATWNSSSTQDGEDMTTIDFPLPGVTETPSLSSPLPLPTQPNTDPELSFAESILLLSDDQRALAEEILDVFKYTFLAMALPATVCNMVVFLQRDMRSATSTYVIGLSLAQLVYILTSIIGNVMEASLENPMNNIVYLIYSVYVSSYLSIVVRRASYLVMCLVSLERLYAVIRPFHIKDFVLYRFPVLIMSGTYITVALWHVYVVTKTHVVQVVSSRTGQLVYTFQYTEMYKTSGHISEGFATSAPILMTYMGLSALIVLNVTTIWALRRHNMATKNMKSSTSEEAKRVRERQMTLTILAYTIFYVVLSLPYALHTLIKSLFTEYDKREKYENLYYVMRSFGFTLTILSCAVDFVCFFVLSSNYRKTLFRLLGVRRKAMAATTEGQTADSELSCNSTGKF